VRIGHMTFPNGYSEKSRVHWDATNLCH
jgi:hypothetical protein